VALRLVLLRDWHAQSKIRAQPEFNPAFKTSKCLDHENLSPGPLGPGPSASKELRFLVRTEGFFPTTSWYRDKRHHMPSENRAAATDFSVPDTKVLAQICHTRLSPTSKLPFFVGAGGFEPPASWSRKKIGPSFWRKSGGFEAKRVHTALTVHEVSKKLA
jgi:hypothetical protein